MGNYNRASLPGEENQEGTISLSPRASRLLPINRKKPSTPSAFITRINKYNRGKEGPERRKTKETLKQEDSNGELERVLTIMGGICIYIMRIGTSGIEPEIISIAKDQANIVPRRSRKGL